MGDWKGLFDELNQFETEQTIKNVFTAEAFFVLHDILEGSRHRNYTFHRVSRDCLNVVDVLATQAKLSNRHGQKN